MSTFTLAISYLTTSNLPWSMDLTFKAPMQYCSLQHRTLLPWLRSVKYTGNRDSVRLRKCRTRQHSFKHGSFPAVSHKVSWSRSRATEWASKPHKKRQTWRGAGHHLDSMFQHHLFPTDFRDRMNFHPSFGFYVKNNDPSSQTHTHIQTHTHSKRLWSNV